MPISRSSSGPPSILSLPPNPASTSLPGLASQSIVVAPVRRCERGRVQLIADEPVRPGPGSARRCAPSPQTEVVAQHRQHRPAVPDTSAAPPRSHRCRPPTGAVRPPHSADRRRTLAAWSGPHGSSWLRHRAGRQSNTRRWATGWWTTPVGLCACLGDSRRGPTPPWPSRERFSRDEYPQQRDAVLAPRRRRLLGTARAGRASSRLGVVQPLYPRPVDAPAGC